MSACFSLKGEMSQQSCLRYLLNALIGKITNILTEMYDYLDSRVDPGAFARINWAYSANRICEISVQMTMLHTVQTQRDDVGVDVTQTKSDKHMRGKQQKDPAGRIVIAFL